MMTTRQPTSTTQRPPVPGTGRYAATVIALPALAVVTGLALVAGSWSQLPAVVASHWGPNGVDGTQTLVAYTVTATAFVVGLSLLLALVAWGMPGDGRRVMATTVGVMSGFLGAVLYGALLGQRGVTDPSAATLPPGLFLVGALVGATLGAVAWMLNPVLPRPDSAIPAVPADAPRIPLAAGERLVWFGWTAAGSWLVWVAVALAALGCFVAVVARPWAAVGPAFGIVMLLLVAHARVVVDADGLRVTSAGIVRWLRVPLSSVAYAERSELRAFQEFGGFGLRFRADQRAFVTRSGEALRVVQRDGTRTYVSVDGAGEAAAVLNALVTRAADA
ncbi:MAG: hypothetical protein ACHP7G_08150 [Actinomycetales bacterium]